MSVRNEKVIATAYFHEQGSVLKGDAEGFCDKFELNIELESDDDIKEITTLIRLAHRLCFAEKAVIGSVPIIVTQQLNGQPLIID